MATSDGTASEAAPPPPRSPPLARLRDLLLRPRVYLGFLLLLSAAAAVHMILLGPQSFGQGQIPYGPRTDWLKSYTHFNNYLIFRQSFAHLAAGRDIYGSFPLEHFDYFKYSPTFATLMAPFAFLPIAVGAVLWNLVNAGVLVVALRRLPGLDDRAKGLVAWFIAPEFLGAAQNLQTNILVLGLLLLAFAFCERRKAAAASLMVVLTFYIKIFGLLAALVFLLYPNRRRLLLSTAGWIVALGLLPLLVVSPEQLVSLYRSWVGLLRADRMAFVGMSVMGWLHAWFRIDPSPLSVLGAGMVLALVPLANVGAYRDFGFRRTYLASLLVWVVIFNHKAESSTFVIAMFGVALWYFSEPRRPWRLALAALSFLLTSVAYSDLTPGYLRSHLVNPYVLKVVPLLLVFAVLVVEGASWPPARGAREAREAEAWD
ncbi:MAG TPA: glycosyltransferase family 87 protein [Anaeromyxobacteraceae bacterium]|nr:glycosyltransferase family 87 protein [Anaeromyxobacteraceae bacterium]